jgi:hypothetical protein
MVPQVFPCFYEVHYWYVWNDAPSKRFWLFLLTHTTTICSCSSPGGFVGEHEAGQRLLQTAHDPRCAKSGVYWSWNGGPREGRGAAALEKGGQISGGGGAGGGWDSIFENDQSAKVLDVGTSLKLYEYATQITGAEWPELRAIVSPCPTLNVVGAITRGMVQREELKRVREMGRPGLNTDGTLIESADAKPKISKAAKVALVTDRVASGVLSNTVGRVARFFGRRLLGRVPETALQGSYHPVGSDVASVSSASTLDSLEENQELLEQEISSQLQDSQEILDTEDEALFTEIYDSKTETPSLSTNHTSVGVTSEV